MSRSKAVLARMLWHAGLIALAGRIRRSLRGPRLVILCYHRIDSVPGLAALAATPEAFARQLAWFSRRFSIWSLARVAGYLARREELAGDAVVLTFDDGYADNFRTVLPMLRARGIPATYFISSEPLLERRPYWYDALWLRLGHWSGEHLPADLLEDLPAATAEALEAYRSGQGTGDAGTARMRMRQSALDACKGLPARARGNLMDALRMRAKPSAPEPVCETMTLEEARQCVAGGVEMGGHSRSHPSLARIPDAECRAEIDGGLRDLRNAGFTVKRFAYPFGEAADVGGGGGLPRRVLSDLGLELAVTTEERAVRRDDDPLRVPRKVITPQSLPQIALKLELLAWRR